MNLPRKRTYFRVSSLWQHSRYFWTRMTWIPFWHSDVKRIDCFIKKREREREWIKAGGKGGERAYNNTKLCRWQSLWDSIRCWQHILFRVGQSQKQVRLYLLKETSKGLINQDNKREILSSTFHYQTIEVDTIFHSPYFTLLLLRNVIYPKQSLWTLHLLEKHGRQGPCARDSGKLVMADSVTLKTLTVVGNE